MYDVNKHDDPFTLMKKNNLIKYSPNEENEFVLDLNQSIRAIKKIEKLF